MTTQRSSTASPLFRLALIALAALVAPQWALAQEKVTIRIGSPFKSGHILVDAAEKFKELAELRSNGRIAVTVDAGTKSEEQASLMNSKGELEMQSNGHHSLENFARPYFFFNAPYVMKDFDHFMRVWNGPLGADARKMTEQKGNVKFLGMVYRGLRQTTAKKPIYTPADIYGVKLRLPVVATWIAVWKAMDADPVPLPLPELYAGLKSGKADASEGDLPQIASFKLDEVQSHLIMTNHLVQTGGMLINKSFFNKLSKANQKLVTQAAKDACDWANGKMKGGELALLIDLQRKGLQVVIPDAETFRVKAKPAVEELFQKEWPVTTWAKVLAQ
ncbi:MAG: TRAP transporter substrate-binding protein [Rhodocyclaceae bacterium]|nr:MAG: TRAP transporter substrate-binding protein [Rhodocyclaceae bacterium]